MERLMYILNELDDTILWETEEKLIDDHILDSLKVIMLISEIENEFDIEIHAEEIRPENLNSAKKMWTMIQRLQG